MPWTHREILAAGATLGALGLVGGLAWLAGRPRRRRPKGKRKPKDGVSKPGDHVDPGPLETLPADRPKVIAQGAVPTEVYRGFSIYVEKPKAAWRWVVALDRQPLATGESVISQEASQAARNWVDLLLAAPPKSAPVDDDEVLPDPYEAAKDPTPGEPTDLALPHWFSLGDYWILVQFTGNGFIESAAFPTREHWRWRTMRGDKILVTGWAKTARDARDEANIWIASDMYLRGVKWIVGD